jgi:hypothetical protein
VRGCDSWEAVPVDWHLTGVSPTTDDDGEAFVYSNDLWAVHLLPELWVSCLGICGHRVAVEGAAIVLNAIARRMIAGDLGLDGEHAVPFDSGAVLRFFVGAPSTTRREELEMYMTMDDAPVSEVVWSCCAPSGPGACEMRQILP